MSCLCNAQVDSSYIKTFDHVLSVRFFISKEMLFLNQENSNESKTYMPNNPPKLGAGMSLNNTILSFSYGYGFDFMRDKELGKTRSFDFQLHNYGRKFVFDLFIQRYKGFYMEDDKNNITLCPDLKIHQYGLYGQYVFNNKKYSYKAAFVQNERQLKSTGSFLIGGGIYFTNIESDSSFVYMGKNSLDNFQFGLSGGYTYTWVLGRYWDISASTTVGINFGSEKINSFGKQRLEVYPTVFPRFSAGYKHDSWAIGFSYVGNIVFSSVSDELNMGTYSGNFQISFVKHFTVIPLVSPKINKKVLSVVNWIF